MDSNSGKLFSTYITTLRYTPIKLMEQQSGKKVGFLMGLYCITLGKKNFKILFTVLSLHCINSRPIIVRWTIAWTFQRTCYSSQRQNILHFTERRRCNGLASKITVSGRVSRSSVPLRGKFDASCVWMERQRVGCLERLFVRSRQEI